MCICHLYSSFTVLQSPVHLYSSSFWCDIYIFLLVQAMNSVLEEESLHGPVILRRKRAVAKDKNTCQLFIQTDHLFYKYYSSREAVIAQVHTPVHRYRDLTEFWKQTIYESNNHFLCRSPAMWGPSTPFTRWRTSWASETSASWLKESGLVEPQGKVGFHHGVHTFKPSCYVVIILYYVVINALLLCYQGVLLLLTSLLSLSNCHLFR